MAVPIGCNEVTGMDISILQEFVVLAQSETFLKAADILFISQPTLSRHIKSLEAELGVSLFERTTRSLKLSKYGEMLLPYAKQIVELNNQFSGELQIKKQDQHVALRLTSIAAMEAYGITDVLTRFKEKYKNAEVNILTRNNTSFADMLQRRECEVAFIRDVETETVGGEDLERLPFAEDRLVAVVPKSHPFASLDCIHLADCKDESFITLPRDTSVCEKFCLVCEKEGFEPNIVITHHNVRHILTCVSLGMGTAILAERLVDEASESAGDVKMVKLIPEMKSHIMLCYLKQAHLSETAKNFIKLFEEEFEMREA